MSIILLPNRSTPFFKRPLLTAMVTALVATISVTGCSSPESNDSEPADAKTENQTADHASNVANNDAVSVEKITVDTVKGNVDLAMNPSPLVVYDMTLMQDLAALDVAVDGMPSGLKLDNLQSKTQPEPKTVGTVFEPDLEALNAMQPQAILVGSRMAEKYEALSSIAPTLDMTIDTANIYESSKQRLHDLGALFGKSAQAAKLQGNIDGLIDETKTLTKDKGKGLVVMVNGNKLSAYGDKSRYGFIHTVLDIPMADDQIADARHGQPISFEYIQKTNPDWLFVVDRSAAIGEDGAGAKAVLDNPLVAQTNAWSKNQVVYLSPDSYLAFGGYYQWMQDLTTIKEAFANAK
ncbi:MULTISPECIES: siderophore ABC transporter substrate-binding protein [unclassified Psychrobacter]|uniref:siderophore ABC transporter substrate-binding protein n=1 Tax=unclassified Psychrobacter TaxID=196806 RepID=UPI000EC6CC6A|nr:MULTISPECIES: siderophore ABC transporter substrate-binding protein [unclassified Psychrobacter]MBE8609535.1 siderophore ABC transporter substrate-binding protein [Pseudomonas lundensis]HCI77157.1 ABC transporter substrate-binding protein [Psychrobacter sp.]